MFRFLLGLALFVPPGSLSDPLPEPRSMHGHGAGPAEAMQI